MRDNVDSLLGRRQFLKVFLAIFAPVVIAASGQSRSPGDAAAAERTGLPSVDGKLAEAARLQAPTLGCEDDDDPTPAAIEGPFYRPKSPSRTSLWEPGLSGIRIVLAGQVFSRSCKPIPRALLDFWHADDRGDYDNVGFQFRGHQYTSEDGRYRLETIIPGEYGFRTRHFHVKVQAPNSRILTTQLYFPGEPRNTRDFLFRPELLMSVNDTKDGKHATFNFILNIS